MRTLRGLLTALAVLLGSCGALSVHRRAVTPPVPAPQWNHEWSRGAVAYEIFVRSFADSNGDGNGDLNGITSRLDYLAQLGVDAIWLTPIFQSPSYHGYDTTDYETIEKDFGTNADFQRFVGEAHKRNIKVILDFVMNHTSNQHPWFIESASSPNSPKRNWYIWSSSNPGWTQPWGGDTSWHFLNGAYYYGAFWSGMPDLNYKNPEVKNEMFRLARYWLQQGVDGYRLDATRYLVENGPGAGQSDTLETHQVLKEFSTMVRETKPEATLIGENTTTIPALAAYFGDMPSNFNFPLASAIVDGVNSGNATHIVETLRADIAAYPPHVIDAPFLTNHDQIRIATVVNNDPGKLRNAAAILLTLPGMPFIYYGEEVGMQNDPGTADEAKRRPMPWNAVDAQTTDPQSLLSYYRAWIAARKHSTALSKGEITPLDMPPQVLAFMREYGDEHALVVHNLGASSTTAGPFAGTLEVMYLDAGVGVGADGRITLPPHSSGVWRVR